MNELISKLLFDLLQFRRIKQEETSEFINLQHNRDLCLKFQRKLESVFEALDKYHRVTYDIQGPRDKGADVIIRLPIDEEVSGFVCLQIKSQDDLRNKDYLKILKAQLFDAQAHYVQLLDYYIVLCCDSSDGTYKDKIRSVEADFVKTKNVTVIEPEYAMNFLRLNPIHVDAIVKSRLGEEDIVIRKGLDTVTDLIPTERAILFFFVWLQIYHGFNLVSLDDLHNSTFINDIYARVPDYDRDWFFVTEIRVDQNWLEKRQAYEEEKQIPKPLKLNFDELFDDELDYEQHDLDGEAEETEENIINQSLEDEIEEDEEEGNEISTRGLDVATRISMDLDYLADNYIGSDDSGKYFIKLAEVEPIAALMLDGHIRYGYKDDEILYYMMDLFGPMRGYEPRQEFL